MDSCQSESEIQSVDSGQSESETHSVDSCKSERGLTQWTVDSLRGDLLNGQLPV